MALQRLKAWFKNLKTGFVTQKETRFTREQVESGALNNKMDHDRQMAKAKAKKEESKRKQLEESKGQNRQQKVGGYLQSRQEKLSQEHLENAISLRKFFMKMERGDIEVVLANQSRNETFGHFRDILVDDNGVMYIQNDEEAIPIGGANWGDLVQSPSGMITDIQAGYLPLNLDDEGRHLPSSETVQVPQIIMTEEEGMVFTENHREKYKNRVAKLRQQIQSLRSENAMKEKAMVGMSQQIKEQQRKNDTLEVVAESEQEGREKHMEMARNAIQQYNQQEIELNKTDSVKEFWEEIGKAIIHAEGEAVDDIMEEMDKDEFDTKEEEMRRAIKMFTQEAKELGMTEQAASGGGDAGGQGGQGNNNL